MVGLQVMESAFGDPPRRVQPWQQGSRDLRLDLLRGLCLVKMVLAHGLRTPLHGPLNRIGFISAAEGFFFISGTVLGLVYRKRLSGDGLLTATRRLLRRAAVLWLANFALVLLYSAWDFSGRRWGFFHFGRTYNWIFWGDWHWYSLFSFDQPYFLQILPRYAVFLAISPLALWLLQAGRWWAVLVLSWGLYAAEQAPNVDLLIPLLEHGRDGIGFRHSGWQVLFFTGMVIGYERERLGWLWRRLTRPWVLGLLALAVIAGVLMQNALANGWLELTGRWENKLFARDVIGFARLPNLAAAFVLAFWIVTVLWRPLSRASGWLLLPLGQTALVAFVVHIPLCHAALAASELGWLGNASIWNPLHLLLDGLMILLIWSVSLLALQRKRVRRVPDPPSNALLAPSREASGVSARDAAAP